MSEAERDQTPHLRYGSMLSKKSFCRRAWLFEGHSSRDFKVINADELAEVACREIHAPDIAALGFAAAVEEFSTQPTPSITRAPILWRTSRGRNLPIANALKTNTNL
jgi:hypothetical protein